jgi:predicted metal-binding membrane protein
VRNPPVAAVSGRDRFFIPTCILGITALAWAYLVYLDRQMSASVHDAAMMAQMGMTMDRSWTAADFLFTFGMWAVMMVGMMAAAAIPVLLLFAASQRGRTGRGVTSAVVMFGLGYLAVWMGFSALAALAQWGLHQATLLAPTMTLTNPWVGGGVLFAAGAYQITPFKGSCLTHCRSPLGFLMTGWRDGRFGAFRMGARHGSYCLGCCWALMCVLFVVGVMNLVWVAALSGFVLLEKVGPAARTVSRAAGVIMMVLGIALIARAA